MLDVVDPRLIVYFKIEPYKFLKKYPALESSTLSSRFSRNNFKVIKAVFKQYLTLSLYLDKKASNNYCMCYYCIPIASFTSIFYRRENFSFIVTIFLLRWEISF